MAKLTKYEKETIILFNEGEDTASIYTFNAGLKKRLGRRFLCAGQIPAVHPSATAHERGTQTESKRERQANRVQEQDGIM